MSHQYLQTLRESHGWVVYRLTNEIFDRNFNTYLNSFGNLCRRRLQPRDELLVREVCMLCVYMCVHGIGVVETWIP